MYSLSLQITEFFIQFNPNLDKKGTRHAILFNWVINSYNWKFGENIEKLVKY